MKSQVSFIKKRLGANKEEETIRALYYGMGR